jgi:regulatory protein
MKIPYSLHDNIVVELIRGDFLNEQRFVFSFVRGKFRIKKWGKIKLERELFLRNITPVLIKEAINTINEIDYLTTFNDISARKFDNLKNDKSLKSKNKFITYLQYRGWENDLIFSKVRELY